jgi:hypothetical protein
LIGILGTACDPCNRDGCDALQRRAPRESTSRIAGVVASETDVVRNGCQECGFATVDIKAWPTDQEVTTEAELSMVAKGSADRTRSSANGEYSLPLATGMYVVCFQNSCFNARAEAGETTTLNVRLVDGVSSGFLSVPGRNELVPKDAIFLGPE